MRSAHFLLTRFNVRRGNQPNSKALSLDWLNGRLKIFSEITLLSVLAQSVKIDFWIIFLDIQTPAAFRASLQESVEGLDWIRFVYCEEIDSDFLQTTIRSCLPSQVEWLLTTRLDNDDALHPELIERIQSSALSGQREFINPRNGIIFAFGRLYRKRDYSSPFITLSESAKDFKTVWLDQHQRLSRHGPVRQLDLKDAWIQLVHGGNIANQVRGVRVRGQSIAAGVLPPSLAGQVLPVSPMDWFVDNSAGLVRRYLGSAWRRLKREISDRGGR